MNRCTCSKDREMTCIVHPTDRSLRERITELENALLLIHDRACYSLGVTDDWLMQICGEALEGEQDG